MTTVCPECNAIIPAEDGPTHAYCSAPAGCWKLYGDVLAKEYSDPQYWKAHRSTVDAYSVQHASGDDPRQIQSVTVHLLALHLKIEKGYPDQKIKDAMTSIISRYKGQFPKYEKPSFNGVLNVADILEARNADEHIRLCDEWARQSWRAWSAVHADIVALAKE